MKEFLALHEKTLWRIGGGVLLFMNLLGFFLMGLDKYKAKHEHWRVRERTFFIISALGGSLGVWLGMQVFHHKTLHRKFVWGVPAIFIAEMILLLYLLFFL